MAPARVTARSIQIPKREIVLVEAEEMAEFMEVGGADFVGKDFGVPFGEIPEIIQIENDPRGRVRGMGISLEAGGAFKKAQEVGLEALVQHRLVRNRLVKGDDRLRGRAEFGGQAGADALDRFNRKSMEVGLQSFRLGLR